MTVYAIRTSNGELKAYITDPIFNAVFTYNGGSGKFIPYTSQHNPDIKHAYQITKERMSFGTPDINVVLWEGDVIIEANGNVQLTLGEEIHYGCTKTTG